MRMLRMARVTGVVALALLAVWPVTLRATRVQERIYVAVADSKAKPIKDLKAEDFSIKIDGADQEVVKVEPATEPISAVILTDRLGLDNAFSAFDLRQTLGDFVKAIRTTNTDSKFSLVTFDGPVVQVTKFLTAPSELDRTLGRLQSMAADASYVDGVLGAVHAFNEAPTERRVIYATFSAYRSEQHQSKMDAVAELLRLSRASLWTIEARLASGTNYTDADRELLADRGSRISGGMFESASTAVGLNTITHQMTTLIASQYAVTYAPGGGNRDSKLMVGVKRANLRVLAPGWVFR